MKFILSNDVSVKKYSQPTIILIKDGWNDWWEYQTLYSMYYCTNTSTEWIGAVKIGQKGLTPILNKCVSPDLPEEFESLDENHFFSIGQDVSYYNNLNKLGEDIRSNILRSMNDIALKEQLYEKVKTEQIMYRSLLRDVSTVSVKGQYRRLANGNATLSEYFFEYWLPDNPTNSSLSIHVMPNQFPSTNIHVLIGRNGVGKTTLIKNLINYVITKDKTYGDMAYGDTAYGEDDELFASILSVSFSSFDNDNSVSIKNCKDVKFYKIGLTNEEDEHNRPKSFSELISEFVISLSAIKTAAKAERWKQIICMLNSDPIFNSIGIHNLIDDQNIEVAALVFEKLSSGHKIVLLTLTKLVEKVEERTLVILDEPELHLHPPLLSAFVRALSNLLIYRNAVALIATHSPVIVQEVPSDCVKIISRTNQLVSFEGPEIETFGENISSLTREIFKLEVKESGFHKIITELVEQDFTYEEIMYKLNNRLGLEGKTLLRSLLFSKERD
ncbi:AAA family ATPase [Bacillus cereus]|nr:AAA family ATPase [Bacillus cereus]MCU5143227.1 AAA family ATPase [Bacillus cereus]